MDCIVVGDTCLEFMMPRYNFKYNTDSFQQFHVSIVDSSCSLIYKALNYILFACSSSESADRIQTFRDLLGFS